MKKTPFFGAFLFILMPFLGETVLAQAPNTFHYQAVLRDPSGCALVEANVAIRAGILQGGLGGDLLWEEEHFVSTNEQGAIALQVGAGESTGSGSVSAFADITWGTGTHFLSIALDEGDGYTELGTAQLLSVPYALYAETSSTAINDAVDDADSDPENETIGLLTVVDDVLTIEEAGNTFTADLSALSEDADWSVSETAVFQNSPDLQVGIGTDSPMSDLHVNGSHSVAIRTIQQTTFETLDENDFLILANADVGELTLKLPPASTAVGRIYWIRRINAAQAAAIVVSPESGETIDGASSFLLTDNDPESMKIVSTGIEWFIVSYSSW